MADKVLDVSNFVSRTDYDELPSEVIEPAKFLLLDIFSTILAGTTAEICPEVSKLIFDWGGKPESTAMVYGRKIPAISAAYLNSLIAHARDFDDTHDAAVIHTGVVIVPACLATAEAMGNVSGKELLNAIVLGVEVFSRVALSLTQSVPASGYTYTSLCGYFGAAACAAKLLGLSAEKIAHSMGIAYTQAAGTNQAAIDSALAKRMQPGFAARGGVLSAFLAREGVTGVTNVFEGVNGFYHTYMKGNCDPQVLTQNLGAGNYEIEKLSYKPYPCCRFTHNSIGAVKNLVESHGIKPDEIKDIHVEVTDGVYQTVCAPIEVRKNPTNVVQAQFSIPYTVACQAVTGNVTLDNFCTENLRDPGILKIAQKVNPVVSTELTERYGRGCAPTIVTINTDRGAFTDSVTYAKGHPSNPMTFEELYAKLEANKRFSIYPVKEGALEKVVEMVRCLDELKDIRDLINVFNNSFKIE